MPRLSREVLNRLLENHQHPCISIYFSVSAAFPGEKENPIRFEDLLTRADKELRSGYPKSQVDELITDCRGMIGERDFWSHRISAIAVFCSPDLQMAIDLPRQVPETMIVAATFHTKPLVRLLQTMDRYQVLCLTRKDVRLLEGDRDSLVEARRPQACPGRFLRRSARKTDRPPAPRIPAPARPVVPHDVMPTDTGIAAVYRY